MFRPARWSSSGLVAGGLKKRGAQTVGPVHQRMELYITCMKAGKRAANIVLANTVIGRTVSSRVAMTLIISITAPKNLTEIVWSVERTVRGAAMNIFVTTASGYHCVNVTVLSNISYISALEISGEINNASIFEKRNLILVSIMKTFIQTDKYLYMPGQLVLFRILTITGTKALVSYEDIPEIWIMSPKSKRLAQWKNVPNPDGLLQLDFQLAEEVEEGTYQIFVRTEETSASQGFKVEEYVLPRFSLTIQAPRYVLATASEIVLSVCANYTYGQPVNGTLTLSVDMTTSPYYYYEYYYFYYTTTRKPPVEKIFSGCDEVIISTADIGYVGYQVTVKGSFVEEGTGNVMTATASVEVKYQSSILEAITPEEYWKPGLPYNFRVKVTKLDSSAPEGEVIKICVRYDSSCKNYTVDESGMINAFIPPHCRDPSVDMSKAIWASYILVPSALPRGVVDESVELLSGGQRGTPTIGAIFHLFEAAEVSSGENSQVSDYLYCNGNGENSFYDYDYGTEVSGSRKRRPHGYTDMHDALRSFDAAGVYVISDLTLETRPCHYSFTYYYDYESIDYGVGGMTTSGVSGVCSPQHSLNIFNHSNCPYTNGYVDTVSSPGKIELERTYFPETWLWEIVVIRLTLKQHIINEALPTLPEPVHSQSGETAKDVQLPDTVTKWVGEAVCLHPELGIGLSPKSSITSFVPFFLDLSHPATARRHEKVPVLVSVFNYLTTSLPVTVELLTSADYTAQTYSTKTCVSGSGKEVVKFVVVPLEAGDVNLTFSASIDTTDGSCGGTVDVGRSALTWPVESHPGTVNGSDKVSTSASADLLGPTLENLGNLIRMPYGCGEQNMLNFAPNIYVMRYLASSGQLTPGVEDQLLNYMKTGYQRELLYQHTDGSFSAFGKSDTSGSTWLTAFVLKSFSQADSYITVDENLLLLSKNWLLALQNGDGCFQSVGSVHNTQMQGSIGYSGESLAPLTAYVLVSLLEGNLTEDVQVIANAVTCITAATSSNTYIDALMAYALSLAGESNATTLISDVYNSLTTSSSGLSQALTVEAAGYLLLAILNENSGSYANWAFDIAKLISTYHNGQGGFVSTQDTVVALQSFAAFSEAFPPSETELTISVTASSQLFEIIIKSENRLVLHTSYITSDLPFDVTVEPSGSGCALVTVTHKYNVYEKPKSSAFTMSVKTDRGDCSSPSSLQICASYTYEDSKSNMAVMEVDLQTGHSAVEEDLRGHVAQQIIKRYEEKDGNVFLYLDSVGASEICISFHIQRDYEVDDILPGTVTLYDYYRPEFTLTQSFETGVCDSK
ncbi:alpha-2-macroglobulin-like protein 1 [Macrobrachium rosenbergii]|uniref:alpha-2-macroglobulin-like protein 1 n=1 Tax=Macrobrachium rosenbergii TaxID=79674 RepID=UPI0034D51684